MDSKVLSGLLNPIRMRILQVLMTNKTATTRIIAEDLPNIPPASLYRHINKLVDENILEICEENKIRGTVEKVYRLKSNPFQQLEELAEKGNSEELYNIFYTFTMSILMDYNNYLNTEHYDMKIDRTGFRSFSLYLSDEECDEFLGDLKAAITKIKDKKPRNERRLRKFSFAIMPAEEKGGSKK